jgi:hypothetical protein
VNAYGIVAPTVLGLSVPLIIGLFFVLRPVQATIVALLGAELFLPELVTFNVPWMPPLDKHVLPYLCVLIGCLIRRPNQIQQVFKERWFVWLTLIVIVSGGLTGLTNGDSLSYGKWFVTVVPGLTFKDGMACGLTAVFGEALPFVVGCAMFRSSGDLRKLLVGFAIAGVVYIPFALIEIRLSPQLNQWVYGFQQHEFVQTLRWGGYRPVVFMAHGLAVARFFLVCAFFAFMVSRVRPTLLRIPSRALGFILLAILVWCKSTGAVILAIAGLPVIVWGKHRLRQAIAVALAAVVFVYPILRANDLFPVTEIVETATGIEKDRSDSLASRFINEDALLAKARERLLFGWGSYGRNRVYNDRGESSAVTDGAWIIALGSQGIVGYVGMFGTLLIPVFLAGKRLRAIRGDPDRMVVSGVAFTIAVVSVDLIPNGLFANYPYLVAGALMGATRAMVAANRRPPVEALVKVESAENPQL